MAYWDAVQFYHDGDSYFSAVFDEIKSAKKSIWIETYIFEYDALTIELLDLLQQALNRGCEVKLLVDGFGSYYWLSTVTKVCQEKKIPLAVFHPIPLTWSWFKNYLIPGFFQIFRILRNLGRRNHRKTVVIDEKIVYLGSFNWTQVHVPRLMGKLAWRDSGVRLEQGSVPDVVGAFQDRWHQSTLRGIHRFERPKRYEKSYNSKTSLIRLNSGLRARRSMYRQLLLRLKKSKQKVWMCTAYFLPKRAIVRALVKAKRNQADVILIVPGTSDVPMVRWASRELLIFLIKKGIRVFEYQKSILHAKYGIIDDWCSIGSFNLNHRSLLLDLEVEAIFKDPKNIKNLSDQFEEDLKNSIELNYQDIESESWFRKKISQFFFRLRFML